MKRVLYVFVGLCTLFLGSACKKNIFAPQRVQENDNIVALGDKRTLDGVFQWFKNAYEFRDSTLYGKLLAPSFQFSYYDFNNNTLISWDRGEEMRVQHRLFQSVKNISLTWNNYLQTDTTATSAEIIRSFNLLIEVDANTTFRGTGRVIFTLTRQQRGEDWLLTKWFDDSDF